MGTLFVDKLDPQSGTSLEIGSSGDTITIPSGATITNNGTASGFATTPVAGTEGFSVYMSGNDNNFSDNSWTKVPFNTEEYDTGSNFDTSANKYTAPSAGKYLFIARVYAWGGNDFSKQNVKFYKNGSGQSRETIHNQYDSAIMQENQNTLVSIMDLAQNDYVQVYSIIDFTSGTIQIDATSKFCGCKIA